MLTKSTATIVLLAEDDDDDANIFRDVLSDLDQEVELTVAANGLELLFLLNEAAVLPDLIFIDMNMPYKNGYQCLREIRSNPAWNDTKLIVLSTSAYPQQIALAYQEGADLYLAKCTSYTEFKKVLGDCLTCNWAARPQPA